MSTINLEQILFQLTGISQVPIMNKGDSIGSIDIKGLNLVFSCGSSSCGISNMTNPDISEKFAHITRSECFTNPATLFMNMKGVLIHRDDSGRILSTMLQKKQIVVNLLINRISRKHSDNSTHNYATPKRN